MPQSSRMMVMLRACFCQRAASGSAAAESDRATGIARSMNLSRCLVFKFFPVSQVVLVNRPGKSWRLETTAWLRSKAEWPIAAKACIVSGWNPDSPRVGPITLHCAVGEDLAGKYQQRTLSAQVDTITLYKGSFMQHDKTN